MAVLIIIIAIIALIVANIKIVSQANAFVIERLGAYKATWGTGLHLKVPFIDKVVKKVSLKEQVIDFPPQPVITKSSGEAWKGFLPRMTKSASMPGWIAPLMFSSKLA